MAPLEPLLRRGFLVPPNGLRGSHCGAAVEEPPRLSANYLIPSKPLGKVSEGPGNYKAETYDAYEPYDPKHRPGSLLGFFSVLFSLIRHVISGAKRLFWVGCTLIVQR